MASPSGRSSAAATLPSSACVDLKGLDFQVLASTDEVEIGWRLRHDAWGQGYAREAAEATLAWGQAAGRPRIIAMTVAANTRSWGLMERLGMLRRPDLDFAHPALAADDPLCAHIVYATVA